MLRMDLWPIFVDSRAPKETERQQFACDRSSHDDDDSYYEYNDEENDHEFEEGNNY